MSPDKILEVIVTCFVRGLHVDHDQKNRRTGRMDWYYPSFSWENRLDLVDQALLTDYGAIVARHLVQMGAAHMARRDSHDLGREAEHQYDHGIQDALLNEIAKERGRVFADAYLSGRICPPAPPSPIATEAAADGTAPTLTRHAPTALPRSR